MTLFDYEAMTAGPSSLRSPGIEPFNPFDPLPRGRFAIEASAGTGKTHALATLAARFVAEDGVAASELLIVTFTRAAANELRAKVRRRLVETGALLETGSPDRSADLDGLACHLASVDRLGCAERLRRAVTEFDSATVTTIHGFAFQVRAALGTASGADPSDRILSDHRALLREACTDVLAGAAVGRQEDVDLPKLEHLLRLADQIDGRPDLDVFPAAGDPDAPPHVSLLADLVLQAADLAQGRRRAASMLSFDDVLTRFRRVLLDPSTRTSAGRYLGNRYRVVLIDEFQDTDPVQWDIFSSLFGRNEGRTSLVMVGDPKQSIYGFRGADVHTYQSAVDDPTTVRKALLTNWRSDQALLDVLSALLSEVTFGEGISFAPVEAAPTHTSGRLFDGNGGRLPALSLGLAIGEEIARSRSYPDVVTVGPAKKAILRDLAASVCGLLSGARLPNADGSGPGEQVRPGHVAVLVPRNQDALDVQAALREAHVPAVVTRGGTVLESEAATQMRWLLYAMERPSDLSRVRLAALSWFGGWTARQLAEAGDDDPEGRLTRLQENLRDWADDLSSQPVAAVLARIRSESGLLDRLLAQPDGDRNVTDLDHLAELLGSIAPNGRSGPATLLAGLDEEPDPAGESDAVIDVDEDITARRLESDADCVQVMTTWTAKGLEFPIVCLPMLWWESTLRPPYEPNEYIDPDSGRRTIDLIGPNRALRDYPEADMAAQRRSLVRLEIAGERLRTLYVALTRAQHMNLVWWARTEQSETSAMARVLFARTDGRICNELFSAPRVPVPADNLVVDWLAPVVGEANRRHGGAMDVHAIDTHSAFEPWHDPAAHRPASDLGIAEAPAPDRRYQRWSFSAIVDRTAVELGDPTDDSLADAGAADEAGAGLEAEPGDDPADVAVALGPQEWPAATASPSSAAGVNPMADLVAGTAFGTLVHSVLERADWQAPDLDAALREAVDDYLTRRPLEVVLLYPSTADEPDGDLGRGRLVAGLRTALCTPLGPQFAGRSLSAIPAADRIAELSFDLRLGTEGGVPTTTAIGQVLRDGLPDGDPFSEWSGALADGSRQLMLAGNLTGSIDLIARVTDEQGEPRFVIADYKTNALHIPGTAATPAAYAPARLAAAMVDHDYPLQALLYSVALHRYLRWRLPGYRPEDHLGGVAYLFVRGMNGGAAADGSVDGVFKWEVPPPVVESLSDVLDGAPLGVGA
jgi:exodeoxyribonuclease V beta subunit